MLLLHDAYRDECCLWRDMGSRLMKGDEENAELSYLVYRLESEIFDQSCILLSS